MATNEAKKMADDRRRVMVTLSDFAMRVLFLWGKLHDKPRSTYAAQIIEARCEANYEDLMQILEREAAQRGQTIDELERQWLEEDEN